MSNENQKSLMILLALKDDSSHSLDQSQFNDYVERVIEFKNKRHEDHTRLYDDFIAIYEGLHRLRDTAKFGSTKGKQPLPENMIKRIDELVDQLEKINNKKIESIK